MVTSPSIYDDAEKLRFIGILAYPKKETAFYFVNQTRYLINFQEIMNTEKCVKKMSETLPYKMSIFSK